MLVNNYVKKAVILDTNPGLRNEIKKCFRDLGIETVISSAKYEDVIQVVKTSNEHVQLVVMDIAPGGVEAKKILEAFAKCKFLEKSFVLITVHEDSLSKLEMLLEEKGATDFLQSMLSLDIFSYHTKPFQTNQFMRFLQQTFAYYRLFEGNKMFVKKLAQARYFQSQREHHIALNHLKVVTDMYKEAGLFFQRGCLHAALKERADAIKYFDLAVKSNANYIVPVRQFLRKNPLHGGPGSAKSIPLEAIERFETPCDNLATMYGLKNIDTVATFIAENGLRQKLKRIFSTLKIKKLYFCESLQEAEKVLSTRPVSFFVCDDCAGQLGGFFERMKGQATFASTKKLVLTGEEVSTEVLEGLFLKNVDWTAPKTEEPSRLFLAMHQTNLLADLSATSDIAAPHAKLSYCLIKLGRYADSAHAAKAGWSKFPFDGLSLLMLGVSLRAQGDLEKAKSYFTKAVQNTPEIKPLVSRLSSLLADSRAA